MGGGLFRRWGWEGGRSRRYPKHRWVKPRLTNTVLTRIHRLNLKGPSITNTTPTHPPGANERHKHGTPRPTAPQQTPQRREQPVRPGLSTRQNSVGAQKAEGGVSPIGKKAKRKNTTKIWKRKRGLAGCVRARRRGLVLVVSLSKVIFRAT